MTPIRGRQPQAQTIAAHPENVAPARKLNALDRCEICGAQALVVTAMGGHVGQMELFWCMHHFKAQESALNAKGFEVIVDERAALLAKESGTH